MIASAGAKSGSRPVVGLWSHFRLCHGCKQVLPISQTAPPDSRIGMGSGCAVCAGWQTCVCNSLGSLFPSIAAELDVDKNGFGPSEITAGSGKGLVETCQARQLEADSKILVRANNCRWHAMVSTWRVGNRAAWGGSVVCASLHA